VVSVVEVLETPETTVPFESLRERHPTHKKKGVLHTPLHVRNSRTT